MAHTKNKKGVGISGKFNSQTFHLLSVKSWKYIYFFTPFNIPTMLKALKLQSINVANFSPHNNIKFPYFSLWSHENHLNASQCFPIRLHKAMAKFQVNQQFFLFIFSVCYMHLHISTQSNALCNLKTARLLRLIWNVTIWLSNLQILAFPMKKTVSAKTSSLIQLVAILHTT